MNTASVDELAPFRRRGMLRAMVPLAVLAVIGAGAGIAPALASTGAPHLPAQTPAQVLAKIDKANVNAFSGTVKVTTDLGLPQLPDLGQGNANPLTLVTGSHVIQVAVDGPQKQRFGLLDTLSEYEAIHNGTDVWLYDSQQNSVVHEHATAQENGAKTKDQHGAMPLLPGAGAATKGGKDAEGKALLDGPTTPEQAANQLLSAAGKETAFSVDGTTRIAGRAAYTLTAKPTQAGSLIKQIQLAVDSSTGMPLRVAVYSVSGSDPIFDIEFSQLSLHAPSASTFDFSVPKGATVTDSSKAKQPTQEQKPDAKNAANQAQVLGSGWTSVLEVHGVDLNALQDQITKVNGGPDTKQQRQHGRGDSNPTGLFTGQISSYLETLLGAGTDVSGAFGHGKLYSSKVVTVLITDDHRMFVGAVTSSVLESTAAKQGSR